LGIRSFGRFQVPGNSKRMSAMTSEITPGKISRPPARNMRPLANSAEKGDFPACRLINMRAPHNTRSSLINAMPMAAEASTPTSTHQSY